MRDEMMKSWIRGSVMLSISIVTAYPSAHAQPSAESANPVAAPAGSSEQSR